MVLAGEPEAVVRAADDLVSDLQKVLGDSPRIAYTKRPADQVCIEVGVLTVTLPEEDTPNPESFSISSETTGNGILVIHLSGSDMRGTIHSFERWIDDPNAFLPPLSWSL